MEKTLLEHLNYLYDRRQACNDPGCFVCAEMFLAYKALLEIVEDKPVNAVKVERRSREPDPNYLREREII